MNALALFGLAFGSCLAGAAAAHWWIARPAERRARTARVQQQRTQRLEDIQTRAAIPAAPDNAEGVNRADWDDCELILAATNEVEAGLDQLFKQLGPPREETQ